MTPAGLYIGACKGLVVCKGLVLDCSRNTLFFALFGPLGARFSPPPLRQPHGIKVSHIAKLNHAVI